MKKKLFLVLSMVAILMCLLAIVASAEVFTVDYDGKASQSTDENGRVTLRTDKLSSTNASKTFFGWFTLEGDMYEPGETITITKDTKLYEAYGYLGTNKSFPLGGDSQWDWPFIQLQEDIVLENPMYPPWGGCATVDLNGYTITTTAKNAIEQQRSGIRFVGEGEIIHTGSGNFFNASSHGYGDGSQYLLIGKEVTVRTNGTLFNYGNDTNTVVPVYVYGDVVCSKVFHIATLEHNLDVRINPVKLVVTGDNFMTVGKFNGDSAKVTMQITGGVFELNAAATTKDYWNNGNATDYASKCNITISGGSFNCTADAIADYIVEGYKAQATELNGVTYTNVVLNTGCSHEYEISAEIAADCVTYASTTYKCKNCGDTYSVTFGELTEHTWVVINDVPPTTITAGEKTHECQVCGTIKKEIYYVDITNENINVTVSTDEGEKIISVKVSDVFELAEISTYQYSLTGLKAFGDYTAEQIVAINVPLGIVEINFASNNATLKKLAINDGAVVVITSFAKCSALTHIEIGASDVTFKKGCSNNVIESIRSDVAGANVGFDSQVFKDKKTLTELTLNSPSTYIFGSESFRATCVKSLIIPDYVDITFKSEGAFYGAELEYVYVGRGIKALNGKPFDCCGHLKKVILMEVESFDTEWAFCVAKVADGLYPLEVYIHSEKINLPSNTFYCRNGVTVYSNAQITNGGAFNSCSQYTIYYGIGHKYVEVYEAPGCTTEGVMGYKADCPCGELLSETVIAHRFDTKLTNTADFVDVVYESTVIPAAGHKEGGVIGIDYVNGYNNLGTKTCVCAVCNEEFVEEYPSAPVLFTFLGYSTNEDHSQFAIGFVVNEEAIATYETLNECTIVYGVVGAITSTLGGKAPLEAEVQSVNIINAVVPKGYGAFDFIIKGFDENTFDLGMTMSAYVTETKGESATTVYLQDVQTNSPSSYTLGEYIASLQKNEEAVA